MTVTASQMIAAGVAARRIGVSREYLRQLAEARDVRFEMTPYGRVYDSADVERVRREREAAARAREAAVA
jgi:hypothetical protein